MNETPNAGWGPCPPGELSRLAWRLAVRRALGVAAVVAVGTSAASGLTLAAWAAFGPSRVATGPTGPTKKSSKKGEIVLPSPGHGNKVSDK